MLLLHLLHYYIKVMRESLELVHSFSLSSLVCCQASLSFTCVLETEPNSSYPKCPQRQYQFTGATDLHHILCRPVAGESPSVILRPQLSADLSRAPILLLLHSRWSHQGAL